jgi:1-hydroxycarotenoid 3,4-desaturase
LVLEKNTYFGGKVCQEHVGTQAIAVGPTVLTMPWVFSKLFKETAGNLEHALHLEPLPIIARHFWSNGTVLDLSADLKESIDNIAQVFGTLEAQGYQKFADYSRHIYEAVVEPFLESERPNWLELFKNGKNSWQLLKRIDPLRSMASALQQFFTCHPLRQLFGRYSTYAGGSPYSTPATLLLIPHVERLGVYTLPEGLTSLMQAMQQHAQSLGAQHLLNTEVAQLWESNRQVLGVILQNGERIRAQKTIVNGGPETIMALRGEIPPYRPTNLSALVWAFSGKITGTTPLNVHNIFFGDNDAEEFDALFRRKTLPRMPSVYIYAPPMPAGTTQTYTCLLNAPADGKNYSACTEKIFSALSAFGRTVHLESPPPAFRCPALFARRFPGTYGALYGKAPHGFSSFFQRQGSRHRLKNLYMCGGSVHPGAGVPLATLSGRLAAKAVLNDIASTSR